MYTEKRDEKINGKTVVGATVRGGKVLNKTIGWPLIRRRRTWVVAAARGGGVNALAARALAFRLRATGGPVTAAALLLIRTARLRRRAGGRRWWPSPPPPPSALRCARAAVTF